ncbi:hypothetical protein TNIN_480981 [Trichonephila inaurata madagascariensis]|uniref:Uncharacterized protein n=1 Tax=Trichonephila inaurata madagascariensis TaxID=2747483 RepID=A0A8X6X460_9ARAC|nr:hypothetical protein TNIN_480981 [Trichonephila inaurata madagascariensis]
MGEIRLFNGVAVVFGIGHDRAHKVINHIPWTHEILNTIGAPTTDSTYKKQHMVNSVENFMCYHEEGNNFLFRIVTESTISHQKQRPHLWSGNIIHPLSD